ncbi:hypothetical protein [uncultured Aquimarina sp.]|uniref:hypothetical protein n=1 Tax=uncultured Aquimarina sp. TaxID=575652 RepID=UPI002622FD2C|nr:hypothetical protein [uncultured Aquimarina sp.]
MAAKIKPPASIVNSKSIDNLIKWQKKIDKLPINGADLAMAKIADAVTNSMPVLSYDMAVVKQAKEISKYSNQINSSFSNLTISHNRPVSYLIEIKNREENNLAKKISSLSRKISEYDLSAEVLEDVLERKPFSRIECRIPTVDEKASILDVNFETLFKRVKRLTDNIRIEKYRYYNPSDEIDLLELLEELKEVKKQYKLVQVLKKQIDFVLNGIKKRLRNLREAFTKTHSFHFKNLDDYHPLTLVNTITISY